MKAYTLWLYGACAGAMSKIRIKKASVSIVAIVSLAFVAGCGDVNRLDASAEKIAALEKDVARLRNEVRELRHRIEVDAKTRAHTATSQLPQWSGRPGIGASGNGRNAQSPLARPEMREDPAKMTPEQRRAWHEERRRVREERRRERMSDSEKSTKTNTNKGESK